MTNATHGIIYTEGHEAVCVCGTVLSIYGQTATFAQKLGEHIRNESSPFSLGWAHSVPQCSEHPDYTDRDCDTCTAAALACNADGVAHAPHNWDFGSGETFACPGVGAAGR